MAWVYREQLQLSMNKERGSEDEIVPPVSLVARLPAIPSILSAFTVRVSGAIKSRVGPIALSAEIFGLISNLILGRKF